MINEMKYVHSLFCMTTKIYFSSNNNQLLLLTARITYVLFEKQKGWYTNEIVGHNGCLLIIKKEIKNRHHNKI